MNLEKYTQKAQEAILTAQELSEQHNHAQVDVEHLLLALLQQRDGVVPQVLAKLGVHPEGVAQEIEGELSRLPQTHGAVDRYLSQRLAVVLRAAEQEAERMLDREKVRTTAIERVEDSGIIFLDEIDALLQKRGRQKVNAVTQFLVLADGISNTPGDCMLLLLGATNKPWGVDEAALRPGRFGKQLYVGLPDKTAREAISQYCLREVPVEDGVIKSPNLILAREVRV